jgi:hypothetical protein
MRLQTLGIWSPERDRNRRCNSGQPRTADRGQINVADRCRTYHTHARRQQYSMEADGDGRRREVTEPLGRLSDSDAMLELPPTSARHALPATSIPDAAAWAESQVAAVREDPVARFRLAEAIYQGPTGLAPRHPRFRRAAMSTGACSIR